MYNAQIMFDLALVKQREAEARAEAHRSARIARAAARDGRCARPRPRQRRRAIPVFRRWAGEAA